MWLSTSGSSLPLPSASSWHASPDAQPAFKVPLIGMLAHGSYPFEAERQQSPFKQKLRELGWYEGRNIAF